MRETQLCPCYSIHVTGIFAMSLDPFFAGATSEVLNGMLISPLL